ncbi:MAG: Ureidoglycolate hydrolase [Rhizobiales bacterium]|nr:Ureidoglycolate hydrolase [Hyphomicrobiales bacterium]
MTPPTSETILQQQEANMDSPARHSVPLQELTDEAFAPYGDIIKPRKSGEQGDRNYAYRPGQEETHVDLTITNGEPLLRIMHQFKRGLIFTILARHRRVSQCLGALQGKEWFIAVAAPTDFADDAHPRLDQVTAFRIPGDRIIKLHVGIWHAGPHFIHDECMFLSLENTDTNTSDFQYMPLPMECRIED